MMDGSVDVARTIWKDPLVSRIESPSSTLVNVLGSIIATTELPALGPTVRPNVKSPAQLQRELDLIFSQRGVSQPSQPLQDLLRAAALLWHDHLDEAHTIVQDKHSAEAAFIHGIMHRREPDYSNARYWFQRVGRHVTFPKIAARVGEFFAEPSINSSVSFVTGEMWQPMSFIDACEAAAQRPHNNAGIVRLQHVQRIEFDTLLEYLCTAASAR